MIREIIRPTHNDYTITIPNEYINQDVEFIMFPLDHGEIIGNIKKNPIEDKTKNITNSLFGALKGININQDDYKNHLESKYL
jgi:uncharacterized protein YpuA (DUF1002 family)